MRLQEETAVADEVEGGIAAGERILEVNHENHRLADEALAMIEAAFPPHERHDTSELRSEVAEKRLGLLTDFDHHMLVIVDGSARVMATVIGIYLAGVNAGFVEYLAVDPAHRQRRLGRRLRHALVDAFRADAKRIGYPDLAWVLGEVRLNSPWLRRLVRVGKAVPFDFTYFHPGMSLGATRTRYAFYREPITDHRLELPAADVLRILYAVWRQAYRVSYPLERDTFVHMVEEIASRSVVGPHPEVMRASRALDADREDR